MSEYQLWVHDNGRHYEIFLHRDFFNYVISVAWGSVRVRSKTKTLVFDSIEKAQCELLKLQKTRIAHKYRIKVKEVNEHEIE